MAWAVPNRPSQRVIVIGAGLAGLTAAYELQQHGHRVVVLEARPHPGGRVLTLRHPFDDTLHAEAGGEWIHPEHHYIRHYAGEFGLELQQDNDAAALWDETGLHSLARPEETIPGLAEFRRHLHEYLKKVSVFERPDRSRLADLDQVSYLDFLRQLGASEPVIALERIFTRTEMTVEPQEISALHMLYEFGLPQPEVPQMRVHGGNSLLVEAFARHLNVRLGAAVSRIRQSGQRVRVHYRQRDQEHAEEGDHVLVAIPGTQVRDLRFDPPLPPEIAKAYAALGYGRVMKVVLQSQQRFWEKTEPIYEWVFTPREAAHIYHSSWGQPGPRGLLTFYVAGWGADNWGPLGARKQMEEARKLAGTVWPGKEAEIERGASWFWNAQQWIRGSYAYFGPGKMTAVRPWLAQPVDRIHFAGEHTAVWQGYMNGAVESGLRAAAEIEPAVGVLFQELTAPSQTSRCLWPGQAAA